MTKRDRKRRVLITRPRADAGEVVAELEGRGYEAILEPLMDIRFFDGPEPSLGDVAGLIFTSANGVRAFARRSLVRDILAFAVGDATARTASDAGFRRVRSAGGDVDSLVGLVMQEVVPQDGQLLHVAGSAIAGDLAGVLSASGYDIKRLTLYEAVTVEELSTRTLERFQDGEIDIVLLFSPRTARTFVKLIEKARLTDLCRSMSAICLSNAVAAEIAGLPLSCTRIAREPTLKALLAGMNESGLAGDGEG